MSTRLRSLLVLVLTSLLVPAAASGFAARVPEDASPVAVGSGGVVVETLNPSALRWVTAAANVRISRGLHVGAAVGDRQVIAIAGTSGDTIAECTGGCPSGQGEGSGFGEQEGSADTGPTTVRVGALGKPLQPVARCPKLAAAGVAPVAVAVIHPECGRQTVVVADVAAPAPALVPPSCPVVARRRTVRAGARGGVTVPVRCPRGCALAASGLRIGGRNRAGSYGLDARARPGGVTRLRFGLTSAGRRLLRAGPRRAVVEAQLPGDRVLRLRVTLMAGRPSG